MDVLLELLPKLMLLIIVMIFLVGLLFVTLISVVYIAGYAYDTIFGNSFIRLGHFISGKYPRIKNIPVVVKLWEKYNQKNYICDMKRHYLHIVFHIRQFRC